jgi:hypothetical protein
MNVQTQNTDRESLISKEDMRYVGFDVIPVFIAFCQRAFDPWDHLTLISIDCH